VSRDCELTYIDVTSSAAAGAKMHTPNALLLFESGVKSTGMCACFSGQA
jgi:hypothetical protein